MTFLFIDVFLMRSGTKKYAVNVGLL